MAVETPRFLQTKAYSALQLRRALAGMPIQAGVLDAGDLDVTQRAAGGANMSVDVAAGSGWVKGTFTARQGMYHVYNDAVANLTIAANSSGNPRIDQIVARVYDSIDGGSAQDTGTIEVVQGTATAGATLDNRNGAAALPGTSIRLADVLVASGAASITNANIRDRRPWARGAFWRVNRTTNAGGTSDYTTSSTTMSGTLIDSTNLNPRIECSGVPLLVTLRGRAQFAVTPNELRFQLFSDGAVADWTNTDTPLVYRFETTGEDLVPINNEWAFVPTAGSHLIGWAWSVTGNTATFLTRANIPLQMTVQELLQPSASND